MNIIKTTLTAALLLLLTTCHKEAYIKPKDYPVVKLTEVRLIEKGVMLSAEITSTGDHDILQYGFVWSDSLRPTVTNYRKLMDGNPGEGVYTYTLESGLQEDASYTVRAYVKTTRHEVYSPGNTFSGNGSLPPEIINFEPKSGPVGTRLIIEGKNFALSGFGNQLNIGSAVLEVDSFSEDKLAATIVHTPESQKKPLTISTAGMSYTSADSFDLRFPWSKKKDNHSFSDYAASFTYNNKGYIIDANNNKLKEYDPEENKILHISDLPENTVRRPLAFLVDEMVYVFLENHLWKYNPSTNEWIQKINYPGVFQEVKESMFGMVIGKNVCFGSYDDQKVFYAFDTEQNIWKKKADFPEALIFPLTWNAITFSIDGKGFLALYNYSSFRLWEYNPGQNIWTEKDEIPASAGAKAGAFMIGEEAFIGLGKVVNNVLTDDLWKYDYQTDQWIECQNSPVPLMVNTSMSIAGKAYVCTQRWIDGEKRNEIWEFDPEEN